MNNEDLKTMRHTRNSMLQRCYNPKNKRYYRYGGRGITVCERWLESLSNFIEDMGIRPGNIYSLDRINNDGNYEKNNCRWATPKEQAQNRGTKSKGYVHTKQRNRNKPFLKPEIEIKESYCSRNPKSLQKDTVISIFKSNLNNRQIADLFNVKIGSVQRIKGKKGYLPYTKDL